VAVISASATEEQDQENDENQHGFSSRAGP
jgi:hypothetical protein